MGSQKLSFAINCLNGTLITLIPKMQNLEILDDFRPISLRNVANKIIAKSLANRFRGVLGEWASSDSSRKIHWCFWPKMCIGKDEGDLGFRDFSVFNMALLAKFYWRLMKNPNSLAARVLNGGYYLSTSFLKGCPLLKVSNASFYFLRKSLREDGVHFQDLLSYYFRILNRSMVLAVNSGLLPLVVHSDNKVVIDMINSGVAPQADIGVIIHDILSLLSKFPISISFVPRISNVVAHS
ncbi:hypothetical protein Ddye_009077 [Dipteronia dyeriana]|uniref:RNase H type-1 domain-containing protein n=1 Tax=Dipteronia dyeriana TaxID=168575 RepID=A0AAD9XAP5_9ROSI|nr:hypothetical protein Ddye_009077 [Dipteronia dyeriana]